MSNPGGPNNFYRFTVTDRDGTVVMKDETAAKVARVLGVTVGAVRDAARNERIMSHRYTVTSEIYKTIATYTVTDMLTGEKVMTGATSKEIAEKFNLKSTGNIASYARYGYILKDHYTVDKDGMR